jgi:DNA-binding response OmpR family regulator
MWWCGCIHYERFLTFKAEVEERGMEFPPSSGEVATILVIHPEHAISDFIRLGLGYEGFRVESAELGEDGVEMAQRLHPTVIVIASQLPDMDGVDFCHMLGSNPRTWDIPLLVLAISGGEYDKADMLAAGASDYLSVPFDYYELVAHIRQLLHPLQRIPLSEDTSFIPAEWAMWMRRHRSLYDILSEWTNESLHHKLDPSD